MPPSCASSSNAHRCISAGGRFLLLGRDRRPADAYRAGQGVRRDYAHLAITFCPAMNILARCVVGYIP
jgi:transglutaminase-like putative cysteine protease